jgi:hypothetical protein
MGASAIMIVRHAEKPGSYNGQTYNGVDALAANCGSDGAEDLVTLGWERAGALVTLFAPPWGPKSPLVTPQFLFAADPAHSKNGKQGKSNDGSEPSQRPYETLTAVAAALVPNGAPLPINKNFSKKHFSDMVGAALACNGPVLISWQHEDIPAIGQAILTQTDTPPGSIKIPTSWSGSRYDLVWIFKRHGGSGPIASFSIFAQMLLAGDGPAPPVS